MSMSALSPTPLTDEVAVRIRSLAVDRRFVLYCSVKYESATIRTLTPIHGPGEVRVSGLSATRNLSTWPSVS
jgi:hypothetical protein